MINPRRFVASRPAVPPRLVMGGAVKGVYDILLVKFQKVRPPEEARAVGD